MPLSQFQITIAPTTYYLAAIAFDRDDFSKTSKRGG